MTQYYDIAGVVFRLDSEFPIEESGGTELFRCMPSGEDVAVSCRLDPRMVDLPPSSGTMTRVSLEEDRLVRDYFMQTPHSLNYMRAEEFPGAVNISWREDCLHWSAAARYLWQGVGLTHQLLQRDRLTLHCSFAVTPRGKALLFTAPSGTGKSTQAALWQQYRGGEIINGDKCALRQKRGMVYACGVPTSGTSRICLPGQYPVAAVVRLSQAPSNRAVPIRGLAALQAVGDNMVVDKWRRGEAAAAAELLSWLLDGLRVFTLECTPDELAIEELERALAEEGIEL